MELEITQQFDNKLLHRKEIQGLVSFSGATPSNDNIRIQLATKLSIDKELVVVDHIYNTYGIQEAKIFAKAYEKKEFLDTYEPKPKEKKEEGEAAPEGEEAKPKEAAREEKQEGKKEEKPEEKKPEAPKEEKPAEKSGGKPEEKPSEKPADEKPPEAKTEEQPPEVKETPKKEPEKEKTGKKGAKE